MRFTKLMLVALSICATLGASSCSKTNENETITLTDMVGDTVTIKKNPSKVACVSRTTYDLLIAYGLGDKIDGVYNKMLDNSWTKVFYPKSESHYPYEYKSSYELFISRGVDLVFAPEKYIADDLRTHGINAICISLYGNPTFDNYVTYFSNLVTKIWDDELVKAKANAWNTKVNDAITNIQTELAKHELTKKKLFYVRGDKDRGIGYTDTKGSFTEYAYRVLGFDNMSSSLTNGEEMPSAESICSFNPDVFVMGGIYENKHVSDIKTTEPYSTLDAVKNSKIYTIPVGLTQMEQLNALTPEFFYDQANKLYPEYFHYDVHSMIKSSVKEYFGTELTDQQVSYMMQGLSSTGGNLY